MSELRKFIQEEAKKARIEALKSCTYEQICDLLDNQEKQMKDLERQLAGANKYKDMWEKLKYTLDLAEAKRLDYSRDKIRELMDSYEKN